MSDRTRLRPTLAHTLAGLLAVGLVAACGTDPSEGADPVDASAPEALAPVGTQLNLYTQEAEYEAVAGIWGQLPEGRTWGATSAVYPSPDGMQIWVGERCGANTCSESPDVDPILLFDLEGNLIRSFGAGMVRWPHGLHVDAEGNVWVADAFAISLPRGDAPMAGVGHSVLKFSPEGELLMTLGEPGVPGNDETHFQQPSDVLVAPDGSIFVVDGHNAGGNNRVVKFDATGQYLMEWGSTGGEDGEFRDPHALAMDSQGRLFVGDRGNSRVQVFTQEGEHLATWTQFGRPSGLFIDQNDVLYATDSESNTGRNPGWKRGIYIGSVADGWATAFIEDPVEDQDSSATSGAEGVAVDAMGNVYGAEVGPQMLRKYVKR